MSACPFCREIKTRVVETRTMQNGWTRRWRFCEFDCKERWYSYEIPESALAVSNLGDDDLKEFPRRRK